MDVPDPNPIPKKARKKKGPPRELMSLLLYLMKRIISLSQMLYIA